MARKPSAGPVMPKWIVTFADLMSLLLTFFILLLSMAEIDASKFRKIAGSLKMAFGVQRVTIFDEPPAGSSFVQQEYRAGGSNSAPLSTSSSNVSLVDPQLQAIKQKQEKDNIVNQITKRKLLEANAKKVFGKLEPEIKQGLVNIIQRDSNLVIIVAEEASFAKDQASVKQSFSPLLDKISDILDDVKGDIVVAGYTDDRKLKSAKYRDNWELSAARAMNFGQALMKQGSVPEERLTIEAHGPTKSLLQNNSDLNRKKNRRIEIIIEH